MPTVAVPASKVVVKSFLKRLGHFGRCSACGAKGWLVAKHGYPAQASSGAVNELNHIDECPMNHVLDDQGNIVES